MRLSIPIVILFASACHASKPSTTPPATTTSGATPGTTTATTTTPEPEPPHVDGSDVCGLVQQVLATLPDFAALHAGEPSTVDGAQRWASRLVPIEPDSNAWVSAKPTYFAWDARWDRDDAKAFAASAIADLARCDALASSTREPNEDEQLLHARWTSKDAGLDLQVELVQAPDFVELSVTSFVKAAKR